MRQLVLPCALYTLDSSWQCRIGINFQEDLNNMVYVEQKTPQIYFVLFQTYPPLVIYCLFFADIDENIIIFSSLLTRGGLPQISLPCFVHPKCSQAF